MRIFVSWSGPTAKQVAENLREWLPLVLQYADPWVSDRDIWKGSRWNEDVARELVAAKFGIICLAEGNLTAPWLLFESGALAARLDVLNQSETPANGQTRLKSRVTPYLFGVQKSAVVGPLEQFQAAAADKTETSQLLSAINGFAGSQAMDAARLAATFEKWWPELEAKLASIPPSRVDPKADPPRQLEDLVEEVLEIVRDLSRRPAPTPLAFSKGMDLKQSLQFERLVGERLMNATTSLPSWTELELQKGYRVLVEELGAPAAVEYLGAYLTMARATPRAPDALEEAARRIGRLAKAFTYGHEPEELASQ